MVTQYTTASGLAGALSYDTLDRFDSFITGALGWTKIDTFQASATDQSRVWFSEGEIPGKYAPLYTRVRAFGIRLYFFAYTSWDPVTHTGSDEISDSTNLLNYTTSPVDDYVFFGNKDSVYMSMYINSNLVCYWSGFGYWDSFYTPAQDPYPVFVMGQNGNTTNFFSGSRVKSYGHDPEGFLQPFSTYSGGVVRYTAQDRGTFVGYGNPNPRDNRHVLMKEDFYTARSRTDGDIPGSIAHEQRGEMPGTYRMAGDDFSPHQRILGSGIATGLNTTGSDVGAGDWVVIKQTSTLTYAIGPCVEWNDVPNDILNVRSWLSSEAYQRGGPGKVSSLVDLSVNVNNLDQATESLQPIVSSPQASYNQHAVLDFTGSQSIIGTVDVSNNYTMFVVGHYTSDASTSPLVYIRGDVLSNDTILSIEFNTTVAGSVELVVQSDASPLTLDRVRRTGLFASTPYIISATVSGATTSFFVNGDLAGTSITNSFTAISGSTDLACTWGASLDSAGLVDGVAHLNGSIAESVIYNRDLTTEEHAQVVNYLGQKYDIGTFVVTVPLSKLDYSEPVVQEFPATALAFATLVGDVGATPDDIYLCQDSSGGLTSEQATNLPEVGSPLYEQTAVGFYDGSSMAAQKAVEVTGSANYFQASSNTVHDATGSIAFLCVFRMRGNTNDLIVSKSLVSGYDLSGDGTRCRFQTQDTSSNTQTAEVLSDFADGAWHVAIGGYHSTDNVTHIHTDVGSATDSSPTLVSNLSTATPIKVLSSSDSMQVKYLVALTGAAAEALLDLGTTAVTNFWKHGSDPTGEMTSTGRASILSVPVDSDGSICHYAEDTVSIGYNGTFTDTKKFGLYCNKATTNLVTDSEVLSTWVSSNMTETDGDSDSPDGFRNATKLASTASNGYTSNVMTTVAATEYTQSLYIKNSLSGDTSGRIIFYNQTGSSEIASQVFTTSTAWTRISLTATSAVGQISSSFRIEIDTSGNSILAWGAQCEIGNTPTTYLRSLGTASTSASATYSATFTTTPSLGEIKTTLVEVKRNSNSFVYNYVYSGDSNRRTMTTQPTTVSTLIYADNSAIETTIVSPVTFYSDVQHVNRSVWDQSVLGIRTLGTEAYETVDGYITVSQNSSPWENPVPELAELAGTIYIGSNAGVSATDIVVQSLESYDQLSEGVPVWDFSSPNGYETDYWDMQTQTVAGKYDNGISTATLDNTGGLTTETLVGIRNNSQDPYNTWEADTGTDILICSDSTIGNTAGQSFSVRIIAKDLHSGTDTSLFSKYHNPGSGTGWLVYTAGTELRFFFSGAWGFVRPVLTVNLSSEFQHIAMFFDSNTNTLFAKTDSQPLGTSIVASGANYDSSAAFSIGNTFQPTEIGQKTIFAGICIGSNAQAYYDETVTLPRKI